VRGSPSARPASKSRPSIRHRRQCAISRQITLNGRELIQRGSQIFDNLGGDQIGIGLSS
jgi:hypothetical protein